MLTGAMAMVRCLQEEGVELVFGYPGAAICPFYDALFSSPIRHILVRTEQSAAHAASGYARCGSRPGVCIATSGPGATNLITGIAAAYMDSIPIIAITGQVSRGELGKDVFQEADVTGACASFVKHSYLVTSAGDLPRIFREAFHIAATGRPGPVLIDVPLDVQLEGLEEFIYPDRAEIIGYKPKEQGHGLQIKKALDSLYKAEKPLICCGGGVLLSGAGPELREFANKTGIPVVSTMMGLGLMDTGDKQYLGMLGSYGEEAANRAAHLADLIILCGARVADRAMNRPGELEAKIIHIDIDPAEIGKNIRVDVPIVGDLKAVLAALCKNAQPCQGGNWAKGYASQTAVYKEQPGFVEPRSFLNGLWDILGADAVLAADVGQGQIWCARSFMGQDGMGGRFLVSGGLGAMGYALPAALGAKLARPKSTVLAVCGDGAFQMSMCELATAVEEHIPLKLILFDNRRLGMVRELQNHSYCGRHMATHLGGNPDFKKLFAAYGIPAFQAESNKQALSLAADMLKAKGPCALICRVNPETPSV